MSVIPQRERDSLSIALFLALALHVILVLGLGFSPGDGDYQPPQLEVTLAQIRSDTLPIEADHLAQHHQQGSGELAEYSELSGGRSLPVPAGDTIRTAREDPQPQREHRQLTTRNSDLKQQDVTDAVSVQASEAPGRQGVASRVTPRQPSLNDGPEAPVVAESSRAPRTRRITAVSARAAEDAAYLHDWERRVESVGNQYYPEASIRYGIYGSLRLLVVVDHLGQLREARVLTSSGHAVLDEAALKIVRMAAPFSPFPPALKATTDVLEIVRTWHFQQNRLSSG